MQKQKLKERLAVLQMALLVVVMIAGSTAVIAQKVCINKYHMDNAVLRFLLPASDFSPARTQRAPVDWAAKYPLTPQEVPHQEAKADPAKPQHEPPKLVRWHQKLRGALQKEEVTFTELLPLKNHLKETGLRLENLAGWTITPLIACHRIPGEEDDWYGLDGPCDLTSGADGLKRLQDTCDQQGVDFLYVQAPSKLQAGKDPFLARYPDRSNANVDGLLARAKQIGVRFVDLREWLAPLTPAAYHSMFFRTDHHWKPETALQATQYLATLLNRDHGFSIDVSHLSIENYDATVYPHWFLGSYGKHLTLAKTVPDDLTLLYPKFDVDIEYEIPTKPYDERGDFSVLYDMSQIEPNDYYAPGTVQEPYGAYGHGDFPLAIIRSYKAEDSHKILLIKDSYGRPVSTFLGTVVREVDVIDPRHFMGSIETYIRETHPDIVIVLLSVGTLQLPSSYGFRSNIFDLR